MARYKTFPSPNAKAVEVDARPVVAGERIFIAPDGSLRANDHIEIGDGTGKVKKHVHLENAAEGKAGHWLVKGPDGKHGFVADADFRASFSPASGAAQVLLEQTAVVPAAVPAAAPAAPEPAPA